MRVPYNMLRRDTSRGPWNGARGAGAVLAGCELANGIKIQD